MAHPDYGLSPEVAAVGRMNISGNVIPLAWYKTLTYANGKPHLVAITLLGDIVYWFRPREIRDEHTGQFLRWVKKFEGDWLRRKRMSFADMYGLSPKQVDDGLAYLEERGLIKRRILPRLELKDGRVLYNVLELLLVPDKLAEITFTDLQGGSRLQATPPQDVVGDPLDTPPDVGVSPTGERGLTYRREGSNLQARGVSPVGETDSEVTCLETTDSETESTLSRRADFVLASFGFPLITGANFAEFGQLVELLDDATFEACISEAVTVSPRVKSWGRLKPLLVHPVVRDYMDIAEQPMPPLAVCRDIITAVSDRKRWQDTVRAYCGRYANRAYVDAMLDWYRDGIPVHQKPERTKGVSRSGRTEKHVGATGQPALSEAAQRKLDRLHR
ncbi:MAG: hypothetical protein FOGNACKC_00947 [Anaerolineae bacterium]|nr:hypothetical protein [Anaerolineae bacterium]